MARIEEVRVPDIGDFEQVDVVEVLVAAGDRVEKDGSLIVLESDKASMDVPSPLAGVVREVRVQAGGKVSQGDVILLLEVEEGGATGARAEAAREEPGAAAPQGESAGEATRLREEAGTFASTAAQEEEGDLRAAPAQEPVREVAVPLRGPIDEEAFARVHASPAVRRFARELGVDLGRVQGSGRSARILRQDVQAYVKEALSRPTERPAGGFVLPEIPRIDFAKFGELERRPLSRIRRKSGPNVHRSWLNVPHVSQFDEADITELEAFRREQGELAKERGIKLTILSFIMKACVPALKRFPEVNASLDPDGEDLILKKYIHLGFALDTPDGLLVPVIRDVDRKGIFDLAAELGEVSQAGRDGKLRLDQMQGASFTISSLGGIGGTGFTPIVNAPEVAILGVARARMKPVWDAERRAFEPRLMLPFSLAYDHRVIDGALAARFTTHLAEILSDIRRVLL